MSKSHCLSIFITLHEFISTCGPKAQLNHLSVNTDEGRGERKRGKEREERGRKGASSHEALNPYLSIMIWRTTESVFSA